MSIPRHFRNQILKIPGISVAKFRQIQNTRGKFRGNSEVANSRQMPSKFRGKFLAISEIPRQFPGISENHWKFRIRAEFPSQCRKFVLIPSQRRYLHSKFCRSGGFCGSGAPWQSYVVFCAREASLQLTLTVGHVSTMCSGASPADTVSHQFAIRRRLTCGTSLCCTRACTWHSPIGGSRHQRTALRPCPST